MILVLLLKHHLRKHQKCSLSSKTRRIRPVRGVSANVMCGQEGNFGTGSFQLMLDADQLSSIQPQEQIHTMDSNIAIEEGFGDLVSTDENVVSKIL